MDRSSLHTSNLLFRLAMCIALGTSSYASHALERPGFDEEHGDAVTSSASQANEMWLEALRLQDEARYQDAKRLLLTARELLPTHIPTLIALGKAYSASDGKRARSYLAQAEELISSHSASESEHRLYLGRTYFSIKQYSAALAQLEAAETLARDSNLPVVLVRTYLVRGSLHTVLSNFEEAEESFEAAATLFTEDPLLDDVLLRRLWVWKVAEFQEAIGSLDDAAIALENLSQLPADIHDHAKISFRLGRVQYHRREIESAERHLSLAYDLYRRLYGEDHPKVEAAWQCLVSVRKGSQPILKGVTRLSCGRDAHATDDLTSQQD